jgi:uncharacterized Zn finger protein
MQSEEMRLDGNAAAGALRELFARDMTAALATCGGCGRASVVGTLLDYGGPMGVVLRCPKCGAAMLRMVRASTSLRVDVSGVTFLVLDDATIA